ncbi:hypothetical protein R6Z07F_005534 [Ovis aries]
MHKSSEMDGQTLDIEDAYKSAGVSQLVSQKVLIFRGALGSVLRGRAALAPPPPASAFSHHCPRPGSSTHISSRQAQRYGRNNHTREKAPCCAMKPEKYNMKLKVEGWVWSLRIIDVPGLPGLSDLSILVDGGHSHPSDVERRLLMAPRGASCICALWGDFCGIPVLTPKPPCDARIQQTPLTWCGGGCAGHLGFRSPTVSCWGRGEARATCQDGSRGAFWSLVCVWEGTALEGLASRAQRAMGRKQEHPGGLRPQGGTGLAEDSEAAAPLRTGFVVQQEESKNTSIFARLTANQAPRPGTVNAPLSRTPGTAALGSSRRPASPTRPAPDIRKRLFRS